MSASIISALPLQHDVYARALDARDPRFDGVFFVGIITTRIYCRPVCPARISYRDHRRFFPSAAAAEVAGFRPCMRCRPELAPGLAHIDAVPRLAREAANRIAAGALNGRTVAQLANDLGVSERHLRRALERETGASPLELAQTHRLLLAKRLLSDTELSIIRIAFASGFQSLRRFNAAFRTQYRMTPRDLRVSRPKGAGRPTRSSEAAPVRLSLSYRAPIAWEALLTFLRRDAVAGIDFVDGARYGRTVQLGGETGFVLVESTPAPARRGTSAIKAATIRSRARRNAVEASRVNHVSVSISESLVPVLMPLLARLRQLFDLDAQPTLIDAHLARGPLRALVAQRPGIRIPGALDGFDMALRAILRGSTLGAGVDNESNTLPARVAEALGEEIETGIPSLTRLAPSPDAVADAGVERLEGCGVPRHRANAAVAVARLVTDRRLHLAPGGDPIGAHQLLTGVGVDDQLARLIVMRALSWPDTLPVSDRTLQRAAGVHSTGELEMRSEEWSPWRTYAALQLWLEGPGHRV
ncbi:MAG TPA: AlkA N-terminal domain-containing protein [Gemmatimonadaceae bacterium]|nr:AlkA N-terminal domain-containing protein [Gemmatimonadaceae bacterium]